ncbi:22fca002-3190-48d2-8734-e08a010868c9 [Sclerotinia trifoliorum]|uniref:22fca002-3190-48d2-8734-e08a010868c9 n=1 Tax=Sclerotinia trifoliorum TaxID=28548 RepID=A0A8H2W5Z1_9HELO|nr:22fca002-3190-48d2-8734-e08a010868c9 [Sclerotinia trifoliorum]
MSYHLLIWVLSEPSSELYDFQAPAMSLTTLVYPGALSMAYTAIIIVRVQTNFCGQHIGKLDPGHLEAYLEGLYVLAIIYPVALSMSKLSLLAPYWRAFAVTRNPLMSYHVVPYQVHYQMRLRHPGKVKNNTLYPLSSLWEFFHATRFQLSGILPRSNGRKSVLLQFDSGDSLLCKKCPHSIQIISYSFFSFLPTAFGNLYLAVRSN